MDNLVFNETPTAFPWYEKLEQQDRYKQNVLDGCPFKLLAPKNTLLPFQFRRVKAANPAVKWELFDLANALLMDLTNNLYLLRAKTLEGKDYFYFCSEELEFLRQIAPNNFVGETLNIPGSVYYYSKITFLDGSAFYSEVCFVPSNPFIFADQDNTRFLRLEWWNKNDMEPFYYNDKVDGVPRYKNTLFIDTFTTASEPEIEEEGEKNGLGILIPDFQMAVIKYKISMLVPDYLKLAIVLVQMHSSIILHERFNIRSGELKRVNTSTQLEANGSFSTIELTYEQDLAINRIGCGGALVEDAEMAAEITVTLDSVDTSNPDYAKILHYHGTGPADAWLDLRPIDPSSGNVSDVVLGTYTHAQLVAGIVSNIVDSYPGFVLYAHNYNYDYGFSDVFGE